MTIKFYIVTYNNNVVLNDWILNALHKSDYDRKNVQVFVINNHSNIKINDEYKSFFTVLNNNLRPDFSTGHLSRNHNQAIINGFKSLRNPDCDVVVSCQNDTILHKNWYQSLTEIMNQYTYFVVGAGDQFQAFKYEGVRNIGLYDERFCNIGHQEADYFLRAYLYNKDYSSINDYCHRRVHNSVDKQVIINTPSGGMRNETYHLESMKHHSISDKVFHAKWGDDIITYNWDENKQYTTVTECKLKNHIYYPYFELDVIDLVGKNYLL